MTLATEIEGSYRRQTVETRRAAAPRGIDSKPARPRSGERSYVTLPKCYETGVIEISMGCKGTAKDK